MRMAGDFKTGMLESKGATIDFMDAGKPEGADAGIDFMEAGMLEGGDAGIYFMDTGILEDAGARIYFMDTRILEDDRCFSKYYGRLSETRRNKTDAYLFRKDKNLSLGAGMLLDQGLSEYGLKENSILVQYGENGKPWLPEHPQIHFNLSHSGHMALAVFAETEVGCDVERVQRAELALAEKLFCPGEYEYVAGKTGQEQDLAFCRLWTLKESFAKATGLGLKLPLNEYEVAFCPDGKSVVRQNVDEAEYQFRECRLGEYLAAVCIRKRERQSRLFKFEQGRK